MKRGHNSIFESGGYKNHVLMWRHISSWICIKSMSYSRQILSGEYALYCVRFSIYVKSYIFLIWVMYTFVVFMNASKFLNISYFQTFPMDSQKIKQRIGSVQPLYAYEMEHAIPAGIL